MIDKAVLTHLGWSEELIDEVSRVANSIRNTANNFTAVNVVETTYYSSGTQIFVDPHIKTSSAMVFPKLEEKK